MGTAGTLDTIADAPAGAQRRRVWFGAQAICTHDASPAQARAYADAMARRYAGLRITIDGRPYRRGATSPPGTGS